ncbi:hypothetical protein LSAT2_033049, partial [Lamellibrachia satsuma]
LTDTCRILLINRSHQSDSSWRLAEQSTTEEK